MKRAPVSLSLAFGLTLFLVPAALLRAAAPVVDLTHASIVTPKILSGPELKAVQMLIEEVENRSRVRWERAHDWPRKRAAVLVGPAAEVRSLAADHGVTLPDKLGQGGREGFHIGSAGDKEAPVVWVAGNDARGVLFGVGRLLRELRLERDRVTLPADFHVATAPRMPLRGHQVGYRPKTNSYDGWTVALWEQYIRDLAVFGCNAIELIPPRSDDAADSPHFPLPPLRMMAEQSRLADAYGLDVWIWYPAMDRDYSDPATIEFALKEWGEVFRALPRVDAVLVPSGDPGDTRPRVLLPFLEKQAANLRRYHPKAQMWVSGQGFNREQLEEFFTLLRQGPDWLAGVVYGPQVRVSLADFRKAVPSRYPVRNYPDITHSRHCQYPVPDWDLAFALTEGREVSNPCPLRMARIFRLCRPHTAGFISYSEGCHDDVNKCLWSSLGWDERTEVRDILREYGRYFIGPAFAERFADGLLALEKNWQGPLLKNTGVEAARREFQAIEKAGGPPVKLNWRFQQALYRACYDDYLHKRLQYETDLESAALNTLREARTLGTQKALAKAEAILDRAIKEPVARELRARVVELAEALFQSIRAQLSVSKYQALAVERGANLDQIDHPLSNAGWLKRRFTAIRALDGEAERLARIEEILHRTDPGPGGFYDELGDPSRRPHLVGGKGADQDPDFYTTPLTGFGFRGAGADLSLPRAWWHYAETLFDEPLRLRYRDLDPAAAYRVRVVYGREGRARKVRLMAGERHEIHGYLSRPYEPLEFDVPSAAIVRGELLLTWSPEPGRGGTGRGLQVAEVWLLKKPVADKKK
ncbi:MAG TPA: hypothetical protein VH682_22580 [Gemmataceae bacterium]|jgi:hypothetical protein